jgi:hypothetical protein
MSTVYAPTKASTTPTQAAVRDKSRSDAWRDRPVKREWTRNESEALVAKNLMIREKQKQSMFEQRLHHEKLIQRARDDREEHWKLKTKHSPFAVNLVAPGGGANGTDAEARATETRRRGKRFRSLLISPWQSLHELLALTVKYHVRYSLWSNCVGRASTLK